MQTAASLASCAALLLAPAASADTFVVDAANGPGSDFTSLNEAVFTAPEGSTLILRTGAYSGLTLEGKSLDILADAGAQVSIGGIEPMLIRGLSTGQRVVLRGVQTAGGISRTALRLEDNAGEIWIEASELLKSIGSSGEGLTALNCTSVTLRDCTVTGGDSLVFGSTSGLRADHSSIQAFGSTFLGGESFGPYCGAAVAIDLSGQSRLYAQDCTLTGAACDSTLVPLAASALSLTDSEAFLRNVELIPGQTDPFTAAPIELIGSAAAVELAAAARSFSIASPVRAGESVDLELLGAASELTAVYTSLQPTGAFAEPLFSTVALAAPRPLLRLQLDADGHGSIRVSPPLPAGLESWTLFLQAVHLSGSSAALGSPTALTILDASL